MSGPKLTIITIHVTQREKTDNADFLVRVREALRQKGITLRVILKLADARLPDERLETKALELAKAVLDREERRANEAAQQHIAVPQPTGVVTSAQSAPITAENPTRRVRKWLAGLLREGWKVVVEVVIGKS